jgi:hypothetical protein
VALACVVVGGVDVDFSAKRRAERGLRSYLKEDVVRSHENGYTGRGFSRSTARIVDRCEDGRRRYML